MFLAGLAQFTLSPIKAPFEHSIGHFFIKAFSEEGAAQIFRFRANFSEFEILRMLHKQVAAKLDLLEGWFKWIGWN
jgi:hypothetical protein